MDFNDLLNKGKALLNKGAGAIKEAAEEKRSRMIEYDMLITKSEHLKNFLPFEVHNNDVSTGKEQLILNLGLTINVQNARVINSLIPLEETIVNIKSAKESKTEMKYWFIITDKKLWIANEKEYQTLEFAAIKKCEIINKSIMTQYTNFNENAFAFDGTEKDIEKFASILTNPIFRQEEIKKATEYLCGVKPIKQYLNLYLRGMTIGENNEIVFHNGKAGNKLVSLSDIDHVQLLMDNTVVMTKCKRDLQNMISTLNECRKMSIKIVLQNENYLIDVLPQNLMGTTVKREDSLYQTNYNFAVSIMEKLSEMLGR